VTCEYCGAEKEYGTGADHTRAIIKKADNNLEVVNWPPPVELRTASQRFFLWGSAVCCGLEFGIQAAFY
jgi:hypothetical protein